MSDEYFNSVLVKNQVPSRCSLTLLGIVRATHPISLSIFCRGINISGYCYYFHVSIIPLT